jgi:hypothetical protein
MGGRFKGQGKWNHGENGENGDGQIHEVGMKFGIFTTEGTEITERKTEKERNFSVSPHLPRRSPG